MSNSHKKGTAAPTYQVRASLAKFCEDTSKIKPSGASGTFSSILRQCSPSDDESSSPSLDNKTLTPALEEASSLSHQNLQHTATGSSLSPICDPVPREKGRPIPKMSPFQPFRDGSALKLSPPGPGEDIASSSSRKSPSPIRANSQLAALSWSPFKVTARSNAAKMPRFQLRNWPPSKPYTFLSSLYYLRSYAENEESTKLYEVWKTLNAAFDERKFNFVEPFPKEVVAECSICLSILEEPYKVSCCGNCYCKACIEKVCSQKKQCPLCSDEDFVKIPDKQLQRLIEQRKVYCLLKEDGCTWKGEMRKLADHLHMPQKLQLFLQTSFASESSESLCTFLPVRCNACHTVVRKLDMEVHTAAECPMRRVECTFCHCSSFYRELNEHHKICPDYPVSCPNECTDATFKRTDLEQHIDNDCPLHEAQCEYHYAGCEVSMLRKNMPNHMEQNTKEHLSMLSGKFQEMKVDYECLKEHATSQKRTKDIEYIYVSNLNEHTNESMLRSRFGSIGTVARIHMIPFGGAAIIEFIRKESYGEALRQSYLFGINLLKHRLRITPIYNSSVEAA